MTHWNHRVMRKSSDGETWDAIYEVYYSDDGSIHNWTTEPTAPIYFLEVDTDSLKDCLERFMLALDKPILDHITGEEIDKIL